MLGRKALPWLALAVAAFVGFVLIAFPGRQAPLALTMTTGWNMPLLQERIDTLEDRVIGGDPLNGADRRFLQRFYVTCQKIGTLTGAAPQTSRLLRRWLDGSGDDLQLPERMLLASRRVHGGMNVLRAQMRQDLKDGRALKEQYDTDVFYMGDPITFETVAGLYFGILTAHPQDDDGILTLRWRAEIPWKWPTYDELFLKYGDHHAQNFSLPNLKSLLLGRRHALYVDDGLGGHLQTLGLAKPFLAWAEWDETPG